MTPTTVLQLATAVVVAVLALGIAIAAYHAATKGHR
jgi:flagellar biosynthesis protein FliQ